MGITTALGAGVTAGAATVLTGLFLLAPALGATALGAIGLAGLTTGVRVGVAIVVFVALVLVVMRVSGSSLLAATLHCACVVSI
jgi:hypothetical protein